MKFDDCLTCAYRNAPSGQKVRVCGTCVSGENFEPREAGQGMDPERDMTFEGEFSGDYDE